MTTPSQATNGRSPVTGSRQLDDKEASSENGFASVLKFDPVKVSAGMKFEMNLPNDTFVHRDPTQPIQLTARQCDGRPLPSWLTFDPTMRAFSGQPPKTLAGLLDLVVLARDVKGHEVLARITLVLNPVSP